MIWLLGFLAFSEENLPELWTQMHEGQLVHLVEGEPQEAIGIFQALLKDLPNDHPIFCDLLFSLGRAQYDVGDVTSAKKSILEVIQINKDPQEALHYYSFLLAEENPLDNLPIQKDLSFYDIEKVSFDLFAIRFEKTAQQATVFNVLLDVHKPCVIEILFHYTNGKIHRKQYSLNKGRKDLQIQKHQLRTSELDKSIFLMEIVLPKKGLIQPVFASVW